MKHRQTVYYHRIFSRCVCSELDPVSLLAVNCLPKFSAIYKNIYQYVACTARALTCYGTLAHSHTHKYAYKIKHTLKRRPNKSLTSGGSGAPNDGFLQNTLKTLLGYPEYFWISRDTF